MFKIGITGGIGSGKSTVSKIFESFGICVYYADDRAKYLLNNDLFVKTNIIDLFGENSYLNNIYNRDFISNIVFNNSDKLLMLNNIVHPAVKSDFEDWIILNKNEKYIIREAALMNESIHQPLVDELILVTSPIVIRVKRLLQRDFSKDLRLLPKVFENQLTDEKRLPWVQYVIENDDTIPLLPQIDTLHHLFLSKFDLY